MCLASLILSCCYCLVLGKSSTPLQTELSLKKALSISPLKKYHDTSTEEQQQKSKEKKLAMEG